MKLEQKITCDINKLNYTILQNDIYMKKSSTPHFPKESDLSMTYTDVDHFPYTRQFRGKYNLDNPTVWDREAGYRPLQNVCYNVKHDIPWPMGLPKDEVAYYDID